MLVLLPVLVIVAAVLACLTSRWRTDARGAFLVVNLLGGAIVLVSSELLGAATLLGAAQVVGVWGVALILASLLLWRQRPYVSLKLAIPEDGFVRCAVGAVLLLLTVTAAFAWLGPPNTYDGMLYHLPRVMHWRQQGSLAFYPTPVLPQLHHPPFSELVMLHTVLLSGGTSFVNLVSWWYFLACIVGVSVIARELGCDARGQAGAALVAATLPIAILQASGPKNDLVLSFWLICLAWLLLQQQRQPTTASAALAGLALGLAMVTKGSAAVFAAPMLGLGVLIQIWTRPSRMVQVLAHSLIIGAVGVACFAPHGLRNFQLYGSPLGPPFDGPTPAFAYQSTAQDPALLASGMLRNVATQLGTPWDAVNNALVGAVRSIHSALGISVDDPRITWGQRTFYVVAMRGLQEESAPNPIHVVLILVSTLAGALTWRRLDARTRWLLLSLTLTFLVYSALIKWQPATTRFQLPLLLLWAPLLAVLIRSCSAKMLAPLAALVFVGALAALIDNRWRPIAGELSIVSGDRSALALGLQAGRREQYEQAAELIQATGCARIALEMEWDQVEYPWWWLLPNATFEHANVRNVSAGLAAPNRAAEPPCAAISQRAAAIETLRIRGGDLDAALSLDAVTVYLPSGQVTRAAVRYSAAYVGDIPETWAPDATLSYSITITNTGTEIWGLSPRYELSGSFGHESDEPHVDWETERRVTIPGPVNPGQSVTAQMELQAPSKPGGYTIRHRLVREGSPWFSQIHRTDVTVQAPRQPRRQGRS